MANFLVVVRRRNLQRCTLRRSHATLFQVAGGSLRDAQAQLGHSKMSTTLELYTLPIPEQQRAAVEKLSVLMASDGRNGENPEALSLASQRFNELNGRPEWTRTIDLFRVKEAL